MSNVVIIPNGETGVEYRESERFWGIAGGSDGSAWSCRTGVRGKRGTWHKLKGGMCRGYHQIIVDYKTEKVHKIVCTLWHGPCPAGMECRHLDGNPLNNRPENLRWGTRAENSADRVLHGRSRGENNAFSVLTDDLVVEIWQRRAVGETTGQIALAIGHKYDVVQSVLLGRSWTHVKPPVHVCHAEMPTAPHGRSGEDHGLAVLTDSLVREMRRRHENGEKFSAIACDLGQNYHTVRLACLRITWSHVI